MNELLKSLQSGAKVVDVRTFAEYADEHLDGSINVPLSEIPNRISELKKLKGVIVCCASGIRSNKAANLLRQQGIKCQDGGSWLNLRTLLNVNTHAL